MDKRKWTYLILFIAIFIGFVIGLLGFVPKRFDTVIQGFAPVFAIIMSAISLWYRKKASKRP